MRTLNNLALIGLGACIPLAIFGSECLDYHQNIKPMIPELEKRDVLDRALVQQGLMQHQMVLCFLAFLLLVWSYGILRVSATLATRSKEVDFFLLGITLGFLVCSLVYTHDLYEHLSATQYAAIMALTVALAVADFELQTAQLSEKIRHTPTSRATM